MTSRLIIALALASIAARAGAQDHHDHAGDDAGTAGALGPYAMTREASGTSWQPDAAPMTGLHFMTGDTMVMLHGFADLVYDDQGGPRGAEKLFVPSMLMAMAQRSAGAGTLGLRAMLSLDPAMGKRGYPLLFQTGETADGVTPLVDRQHPHDLFMELAATYSVPAGDGSVFGYAGLPGEPALGPPTFMHRASGDVNPEAPLSHHWLDSTHITFGVLTLGATTGTWKLDASVFNGREPDEERWDIETGDLDSASGRVTFNPSPRWSMQASYGRLDSPEQLEPPGIVERTTASVAHTAPVAGGHWSTTLAAGINREHAADHPAALLETARQAGPLTLFARADWIKNEHLFEGPDPLAGRSFTIAKLSIGATHEIARAGAAAFSAGGLVSTYRFAGDLEPRYGDSPVSFMVFLRTTLAGSGHDE